MKTDKSVTDGKPPTPGPAAPVRTLGSDRPYVIYLNHSSDISVITGNGVVQLRGFVNTPEAKQRAEAIARGLHGLKPIDNRLIVSGDEGPESEPTDNP